MPKDRYRYRNDSDRFDNDIHEMKKRGRSKKKWLQFALDQIKRDKENDQTFSIFDEFEDGAIKAIKKAIDTSAGLKYKTKISTYPFPAFKKDCHDRFWVSEEQMLVVFWA